MDLDALYLRNTSKPKESISSSADGVVDRNSNPRVRKMFNEINKIIGRYLEASEKISIMEIMDKYNMSDDMIVCAYQHAKDQTGAVKPLKYVEAIIRNWYDSNLYTVKDVEESFAERSQRYSMYRIVFNELGFRREPTRAEKEAMDTWFDVYNADIELVLEACSKCKNITNPSISYVNGTVKNWANDEIHTLAELKAVEEFKRKEKEKELERQKEQNNKKAARSYAKGTQKAPVSYNKFKNFEETVTKYTPEQLEEKIRKSQEKKFK